jgi:hypothetical protein
MREAIYLEALSVAVDIVWTDQEQQILSKERQCFLTVLFGSVLES